jgi:hypothetical protein
MKLYVANATRQTHQFTYSRIGSPRAYVQEIPAGGQIAISGDLTQPEVESIIQQHVKYGMIAIDDISRSQGFCGRCYSLDRSIRLERIQELLLRNDRVLREQGRAARVAAAVALNQTIEENMMHQQMPGRLAELDISVVEDRPSRVRGERNPDLERQLAESEPVAEGFRLRSDAPPPDQGRTRRRRRPA